MLASLNFNFFDQIDEEIPEMSSHNAKHIAAATGGSRPSVTDTSSRKEVPPETKFAQVSPEVAEDLEQERATAEEQDEEQKAEATKKNRTTPSAKDVKAHVNLPKDKQ